MRPTTHPLGLAILCSALVLPPLACKDAPGSYRTQGAVVGSAAGAAVGAGIAEDNRLLGALIGAAIGGGGGYLIGTTVENAEADEDDQEEAIASAREAQESPATPEDALTAETADVNEDGFVTLDEVIAMSRAGLDDGEMLRRLEATGQVFELSYEQENYLVGHGISRSLIADMEKIQSATKESIISKSPRGARGRAAIDAPSRRA